MMTWMVRNKRALILLAVFLFVFGARLWVIEQFGSSVPYLDQWNGEGQTVIRPWLKGELDAGGWFAAHNEHRIVLTRLLTIGLLAGNGQWDPKLEAVVSSLIYALAAVCATVGFSQMVAPRFRTWMVTAVAVLGALPLGLENTLFGFQSQFYLLLLFSLLTLWGLGTCRAFAPGWWLGAVSGLLACFSMGSGFFAAAAVLIVRTAAWWRSRETALTRDVLATGCICVALILLGFLTRTVIPDHAVLRAQSVGVFIKALADCLAWPWLGLPAMAIGMFAPLALLVWKSWRQREAIAHDERWPRLLGLMAVWVLAQIAAVAFLRGGAWEVPPSRYADIFVFGVLLNLSAALILVDLRTGSRRRRAFSLVFALTWTLIVLVGLTRLTRVNLTENLPTIRTMVRGQEAIVRAYVITGDRSLIAGKKYPEIPFIFDSMIFELIDDPEFRKVLPAALREKRPLPPNTARLDPGPLSQFSLFLLHRGRFMLASGIFLLLATILADAWKRSRIADTPNPS